MRGNGDYDKRVLAALDNAGAAMGCASCGKVAWDGEAAAVVLQIGTRESKLDFLPTFGLICTSCGFIRLHSVTALLGTD